jgi:hypothetical protein
MMPDELVVITSFSSAGDAEEARDTLESAGIQALLWSAASARRGWAPDVRLLVEREDAMEAASFLGVLA